MRRTAVAPAVNRPSASASQLRRSLKVDANSAFSSLTQCLSSHAPPRLSCQRVAGLGGCQHGCRQTLVDAVLACVSLLESYMHCRSVLRRVLPDTRIAARMCTPRLDALGLRLALPIVYSSASLTAQGRTWLKKPVAPCVHAGSPTSASTSSTAATYRCGRCCANMPCSTATSPWAAA